MNTFTMANKHFWVKKEKKTLTFNVSLWKLSLAVIIFLDSIPSNIAGCNILYVSTLPYNNVAIYRKTQCVNTKKSITLKSMG